MSMEATKIAAGLVVLAHLAFVVFVAGGVVLVRRWPAVAWVHLPAVGWGAFMEFSGRICPLTPLEQSLRARAGLEPYTGDFVAQYLFPVLYPEGLTPEAQLVIGLAVVAVNVAGYTLVYLHRRTRAAGGEP
jgi:hypothetical protein